MYSYHSISSGKYQHSYSFEINNKLDSIKNLLEEITQNEQ